MAAPRLSPYLAAAAVALVAEHGGNVTDAAKAAGIPRATMDGRLAAARRDAVRSGAIAGPPIPEIGYAPDGFRVSKHSATYDADGAVRSQSIQHKPDVGEVYEVPSGHVVKGESALIDADGRVVSKWVKTGVGGGEGLVESLLRVFGKYEGAAPLIPAPVTTNDNLMTVYPLADLHIGMYSWGKETGADYDVQIATSLVRAKVSALVAKTDPSKYAVILGLGDLFHQDDQRNVTPKSGHQLDADGRWEYVYDAGLQLLIDLIDITLQKHEIVNVVALPGNHDENSAKTLRVALRAIYRNNPRVLVDHIPSMHWFMRFGNVLLGATHGHTMKPEKMAQMLAYDRKEDWGVTDHRHFFFGHIHHETAKEVMGVRVESFNTPAAKDSFAAGAGHRSSRTMCAITFHREDGEDNRQNVIIKTQREAA